MKKEQYINPYIGGALIGTVLFLTYILTGEGLGISGSITKIQIFFLDLIFPHHVDCTGYFAKYAGGDRSPLSSGSIFLLLGTFTGGLLSGAFNKRLKWEIIKGPQISKRNRLIYAFIGGSIMGYGARLARGCTSGQALSGGALLSVGSWAFMFSVFAGGYLLAYLFRRLWN